MQGTEGPLDEELTNSQSETKRRSDRMVCLARVLWIFLVGPYTCRAACRWNWHLKIEPSPALPVTAAPSRIVQVGVLALLSQDDAEDFMQGNSFHDKCERHSKVMNIPHEICRQEEEIESIFRNLIRRGGTEIPHTSQDLAEATRKRYVVACILIAVLLISIGSFCLLWFMASGRSWIFSRNQNSIRNSTEFCATIWRMQRRFAKPFPTREPFISWSNSQKDDLFVACMAGSYVCIGNQVARKSRRT